MSNDYPPQSKSDLYFKLSQYIDEALPKDEMTRVATWIEHSPECQQMYSNMVKIVRAVSNTGNAASIQLDDTTDFWSAIKKDLKTGSKIEHQDNTVPVSETCSAYLDGELGEERQSFERTLFHNTEANTLLGDFSTMSVTLKQWQMRIQDNCTVDCYPSILDRLLEPASSQVPAGDASLLLLSAHIDQELSPRESIEVNQLLESDNLIKKQLIEMTETVDSVHGVFQSAVDQCTLPAGAAWSAIQQKVSAEWVATKKQSRKSSNIVQMFQRVLPATVAVAAVLVAVFTTLFSDNNPFQKHQTIASAMPGSSSHVQIIDSPQTPASTTTKVAQKTPTSEEYLFHMLESDSSGNVITEILGI